MTRFLIKLLIFTVFPISTLFGVFLFEDGTTDPFYQRFTTPKQNALILGNSKAAQGIMPSILNRELEARLGTKIFNYSFTVYSSPFGPVYLESIKRKIKDEGTPGYFIITVDPWSISSDISDPNDISLFEENGNFLQKSKNVDLSPNLRYLIFDYSSSYYEILLLKFTPYTSKLHKDGWYQSGKSTTEKSRNDKRKFMINHYTNFLGIYAYSEKRLEYLYETIEYLKEKGNVFLIRMPIHPDILTIENLLDPLFNQRMSRISKTLEIPYLDFNKYDKDYIFKDGLHLEEKSAQYLSIEIAEWVKTNFKN